MKSERIGVRESKVAQFYVISQHLISDIQPSLYLNSIINEEYFKIYPYNMLYRLKDTKQSKKYHPEGSVWNHTMLVVDEAAYVREQSMDVASFMWASLLHDIGKPHTSRNRKGRITSYDHDIVGAKLCVDFLQVLTDDVSFVNKVKSLVRYHMHMLYILKDLPYKDTVNLIKETDAFELALLCKCDRMGRLNVDRKEEENNYDIFVKKLQKIIDYYGE